MLKLSNFFLVFCILLTGPLLLAGDVNPLKIYLNLSCLISFAFTDYIVSYLSHVFAQSTKSRSMRINAACSICTCFLLIVGYQIMRLIGETMSFANFSILFAFASATWFGLYCYCHYILLHISGDINKLLKEERIVFSFGYLIVGTILIQVYALAYNMLEVKYTIFTTIFVVLIILVYGVFTLTRLIGKNITGE